LASRGGGGAGRRDACYGNFVHNRIIPRVLQTG
jgi:hypothetical protein